MASAAEQLVSNLNFSAFSKAEELKKRIWFTLGALLVYRFGTYIPLPGINPDALAQAFQQHSQGVLDFSICLPVAPSVVWPSSRSASCPIFRLHYRAAHDVGCAVA